jgi:hypothetical protein
MESEWSLSHKQLVALLVTPTPLGRRGQGFWDIYQVRGEYRVEISCDAEMGHDIYDDELEDALTERVDELLQLAVQRFVSDYGYDGFAENLAAMWQGDEELLAEYDAGDWKEMAASVASDFANKHPGVKQSDDKLRAAALAVLKKHEAAIEEEFAKMERSAPSIFG